MIGYCRVSTEDQADSRLGIEGQQLAVQGYIQSRVMHGWELLRWETDEGVSGYKVPIDKRPAMVRTMESIMMGEADGIAVAYLDRLSRRKREIEDLFLAADHPKKGFVIVALDLPGLDTSTAMGKLVLAFMAAVAEFNRNRTSENTKAALAAKVARGEAVGAPRLIPVEVERYIRELRAGDERPSYRAIARRLTVEGIPTVAGGTWAASTVGTVLNRT